MLGHAKARPALKRHDSLEPISLEFPSRLRGRKILLVTESLGPVNGVSRTTGSLINYLRENGAEVAIVAPRFGGSWPKDPDHDGPEMRVNGYPLPYNPALVVAYPIRLDWVFSRVFRPDIVYLASPASLGFQLLLQAQSVRRCPPICLNFQTDLSAYSEIMFPAGMREFAVWLLRSVQGFLFRHSIVHTVFYPSKGVREYIERSGVDGGKLVHLGRGVDTTLFSPTRRDAAFLQRVAPDGEIVLLSVGRLAPEKGLGFLAQVAESLDQQKIPFKLVIVGGNQNASVEKQVRNTFRSLQHKVVFTGFLQGEALAQAYASADIFLHCSITETFGLVVLEAMASGLPVVARDQGGPSEIVAHERSGYLIPEDDLQGFVGTVRNLMKDKSLRARLATNARVLAEETTWKKINHQVACRLESALRKPTKTDLDPSIRSWQQQFDSVGRSILAELRLAFAILTINFIWLIAVFPLIVHGHVVFPGRRRPVKSRNDAARESQTAV